MDEKNNQNISEKVVDFKDTNETNQTKVQEIDLNAFIVPAINIVAALIIGASIFFTGTYIVQGITENTKKINEKLDVIKLSGGTAAADTGQTADTPTVTITEDQIKSLMTDTSLTFGNKDAKLKFVEFTDPSCPFCHIATGMNTALNTGRFATAATGGTYVAPIPEMKKLVDEGKASITLVFTVGHGAGEIAMQGWYCAKEKGKFWEVHDKSMTSAGYDLINNVVQNNVANSDKFADFVKEIVDPTFMTDCLKSGKYASKISEGQTLASQFGVQGTPGFFIGTKAFNGAYSWADMKATADALL
jgi:protein-disulfide isomerase